MKQPLYDPSTPSVPQTSTSALPRRGRAATPGRSVSTQRAPTPARGTLSTVAEATTSTKGAPAVWVRLDNHKPRYIAPNQTIYPSKRVFGKVLYESGHFPVDVLHGIYPTYDFQTAPISFMLLTHKSSPFQPTLMIHDL